MSIDVPSTQDDPLGESSNFNAQEESNKADNNSDTIMSLDNSGLKSEPNQADNKSDMIMYQDSSDVPCE